MFVLPYVIFDSPDVNIFSQEALLKSNEVFETFKQEIEKARPLL